MITCSTVIKTGIKNGFSPAKLQKTVKRNQLELPWQQPAILHAKIKKNRTGKQNRKSNENLNSDGVHTLECDSQSPISNMTSD